MFGIIGMCSASMTYKILEKFENQPAKELFKVWHFVHQKSYNLDSEEAIRRYKIFKDNMKTIKEHNSKESSFKMGYGPFADMTFEEFEKMYARDWNEYRKVRMGVQSEQSPNRKKFLFDENADMIDNENSYQAAGTDWTSLYEDGVRDQAYCGSCWAFAEAGTIEGRLAQRDKCYRKLSTQQLVSCDSNQGGCQGGHPSRSGPYAQKTGLVEDSAYPYTSGQTQVSGSCKSSVVSSATKYKINGSRYCEPEADWPDWKCNSGEWEAELLKGPVYVGIEINSALQHYQSGIFNSPCSTRPNHAVVATQLDPSFIRIRNSWSSRWGESGNVRIARNRANNQSCWVEMSMWVPYL